MTALPPINLRMQKHDRVSQTKKNYIISLAPIIFKKKGITDIWLSSLKVVEEKVSIVDIIRQSLSGSIHLKQVFLLILFFLPCLISTERIVLKMVNNIATTKEKN